MKKYMSIEDIRTQTLSTSPSTQNAVYMARNKTMLYGDLDDDGDREMIIVEKGTMAMISGCGSPVNDTFIELFVGSHGAVGLTADWEHIANDILESY